MGRPIQKRKIGQGSGKIQVTNAYFTGDGAVTTGSVNNELYIDRQRGSLQFIVKNKDGSKSQKLKLVGKASPAEAEFNIAVTLDDTVDGSLDDSAVYYVTKLHNKTVSCQPSADASGRVHLPYDLRTDGDNEVLADGFILANIDVQK